LLYCLAKAVEKSEIDKEDKVILAINELTNLINALVFGLCASTEKERQEVKSRIKIVV
jgi:hypothetical protein